MYNTRLEIADMLSKGKYKTAIDHKTGELFDFAPGTRDRYPNGNFSVIQDMTMIDWTVLVQELIGRLESK